LKEFLKMTRVMAELRKEIAAEEAVEIAKKFLALGIDIAIIAKGTGLSEKEVLELKASIQN
jgi:hypothetical protein